MPRVMMRASWLARAEARKEGSSWEPVRECQRWVGEIGEDWMDPTFDDLET